MTQAHSSDRTAVVLGATGLIGQSLWPLLAGHPDTWSRVILVSRRPLTGLPDRVENRVLDFENPGPGLSDIAAQDVFCCLGTTRKAAGSAEAFARVDRDYVVSLIGQLRDSGAEHALVVTAMGANPSSRILYNRVKGEVEQALSRMAFPRLSLFRPSLLLGERQESRPLESLGNRMLGPLRHLMAGPLASVAPIPGHVVAQAMVNRALGVADALHPGDSPVTDIIPSDRIARLGAAS